MRGLHYNLKQRLKHGYTKLHELKPNSREVAKRLLELGEIYTDENGFLRLAVE